MGKWYNNFQENKYKAVTGVEGQNLKGTSVFWPFFHECTTKQTIRLSIQFGPTMDYFLI